MKTRPHILLDLTVTIPPLALLKASEAFRKMNRGEILEILSQDQETRDSLFKVLPSSQYDLIKITEKETVCRILLKKI